MRDRTTDPAKETDRIMSQQPPSSPFGPPEDQPYSPPDSQLTPPPYGAPVSQPTPPPAPYGSAAGQYTPPQGQYVPSQAQYAPPQGQYPPQPGDYPPVPPSAPGRFDAPLSSLKDPSFFPTLFSFDFTHFITLKVLSALYGLLMLALGLGYVVAVISSFMQSAGFGLVVLILGAVGLLIYLILARISLEFYAAAIRTAENTTKLLESTNKLVENSDKK